MENAEGRKLVEYPQAFVGRLFGRHARTGRQNIQIAVGTTLVAAIGQFPMHPKELMLLLGLENDLAVKVIGLIIETRSFDRQRSPQ